MKHEKDNLKPPMRYSAAYPTDALEKLCFGGQPHEVHPKGPQGAPRERAKESGLIQNLAKRLFWDVPVESVEEDSHKRFIIQRVLERGDLEDIRRTVRYYSLPVFVEEAMQIRSLDPMTLAFASCLANTPKESFKCYALTQ